MPLELLTWGPAFSLPSLDSQCLAAIAYLSLTIPQEEWVLVPTSDTGASSTSVLYDDENQERFEGTRYGEYGLTFKPWIEELPALRDGERVIGGYENIIAYLSAMNPKWDLDCQYHDAKDRADITAFTAHILSHAPSLIALSLYVSSENYSTTTRPAFSDLLPWPTQYFIPPSHRTTAKALTAHLGLNALDLDTLGEEERLRAKNASIIPQGLRSGLGKKSVTNLVKQQQSQARFRLDALVDAFCDPLQRLLHGKRYYLSEAHPSSLDALALGYLSLALKPDVPQKWLAEGMRERYPALCAYVEKGIAEVYGGSVDALPPPRPDVHGNGRNSTQGRGQSVLPWQHDPQPQTRSIHSIASTLLRHATDNFPFFGPSRIISSPSSTTKDPTPWLPSSTSPALLPPLILATTALAGLGTYTFYPNLLGLAGGSEEERSLNDMGEAGAFFAGMAIGGRNRSEEDRRSVGSDHGFGG